MFPALLHLIQQNLAIVVCVDNERAWRELCLAVAVHAPFYDKCTLLVLSSLSDSHPFSQIPKVQPEDGWTKPSNSDQLVLGY